MMWWLAIPVIFLLFIMARTWTFRSRQLGKLMTDEIQVDIKGAANRLAGAVRIPTLSYNEGGEVNTEPFIRLRDFLETQFPLLHKNLKQEIIAGEGLLYTWQGTDVSLAPILLLAHSDVVPAVDEPGNAWTYPPFSGQIADGFIWGRGTLDDKVSVLGIFEAIEYLLIREIKPACTLLVAIGHDEEVGGLKGAGSLSKVLLDRGIKPDFILDEGGMLVQGMIGKLNLATVGIAEKGYVTIKLSAEGQAGHSSQPPTHTAIGKLCAAIQRVEAHPFPLRSGGVMATMLRYIGPEMPFGTRMALANWWLLGYFINQLLSKQPALNAMMRTTQAVTLISGGIKENILPSKATAAVNCRIIPGETIQETLKHMKAQVADANISLEPVPGFCNEPSPISAVDSPTFLMIQKTISQIFPEAIVSPYLTVGGTDTKHYTQLTHNIYRFLPVAILAGDLGRIHGRDERVSIAAYQNVIRFYIQLLINTTKPDRV